MLKDKRCGTCRYFAPEQDGNGSCRFDPPRAFLTPGGGRIVSGSAAVQLQMMSAFPPIAAEGWCGKWEAQG